MAKKTRKKSKTKKKRKVKPAPTNHAIGVLHLGTKDNFEDLVELMKNAAEQYLHANGAPNDTITIYGGGHYAEDKMMDLEKHADELVNDTDVWPIVAAGGPQSALAAMDATIEADAPRNETPVVFTTVADPVGLGLVDAVAGAGKTHLTGMAGKTSENDPARLRILHAFASPSRPQEKRVGVLINQGRQGFQKQYRALVREAKVLGLTLVPRRAKNLQGIARAFQKFRSLGCLGVVVTADAFFNNNRETIIEEAAMEDGIPAIYQWRTFVDDGGLISYGPNIKYAYEKAGEYVAQILLGANPANMTCSTPGALKMFIKETTANDLKLVIPEPKILDGKPFEVIK